jgi:hypothetical protein
VFPVIVLRAIVMGALKSLLEIADVLPTPPFVHRDLRTGDGVNFCPGKVCQYPEQGGCTSSSYPDLCAE